MALYLVLLALVIACMVALGLYDKPVASVTEPVPSGGDTIDVAIEYSPITYYTYDDTLGGYNYDLLRRVSRVAHREMKFHPIATLQKGIEGLESGVFDVLVAHYPVTTQNRERFIFTQPIYIDKQVLVQRQPARIKTQLQLAGDTVHVVKGSTMVERIASLSREIGDTIHVVADDTNGPEQLVMLVASGKIRLAVVNKSLLRAIAHRVPKIDASVDISMSQFQAWALNKHNEELRDSLDTWLQRVMENKADCDTLQQRYFGQ